MNPNGICIRGYDAVTGMDFMQFDTNSCHNSVFCDGATSCDSSNLLNYRNIFARGFRTAAKLNWVRLDVTYSLCSNNGVISCEGAYACFNSTLVLNGSSMEAVNSIDFNNIYCIGQASCLNSVMELHNNANIYLFATCDNAQLYNPLQIVTFDDKIAVQNESGILVNIFIDSHDSIFKAINITCANEFWDIINVYCFEASLNCANNITFNNCNVNNIEITSTIATIAPTNEPIISTTGFTTTQIQPQTTNANIEKNCDIEMSGQFSNDFLYIKINLTLTSNDSEIELFSIIANKFDCNGIFTNDSLIC